MEGSPNGVADSGLLQARVAELEQELRQRMEEVTRLHCELRHARVRRCGEGRIHRRLVCRG